MDLFTFVQASEKKNWSEHQNAIQYVSTRRDSQQKLKLKLPNYWTIIIIINVIKIGISSNRTIFFNKYSSFLIVYRLL